eukprot:4846829-Alexandrium_andersonii.AAC.1
MACALGPAPKVLSSAAPQGQIRDTALALPAPRRRRHPGQLPQSSEVKNHREFKSHRVLKELPDFGSCLFKELPKLG